MVMPIGYLAVRASEARDPWDLLSSSRTLGFLSATLRLGVAVTAFTLVVGVGIAWLIERTDIPFPRLLGVLAALPLAIPTYVGALALRSGFGPSGLLAELPWVLGFWGSTVALGLATYPYALFLARAALAGLDPALEDASRALGQGQWRTFSRVVLPQLRPAMAASGLLAFLYVLSDFGAVSILQYDTLTRGIFLEYRSLTADRAPAAVLGCLLVAVTIVAIGLERLARGRMVAARAVAGVRPRTRTRLGPWRWVALAAVVAVVLAGLGVPVGIVVYWALVGSSRTASTAVLVDAASTSVAWSAVAGLVAVALAVPVAVLAVRFRSRFSRAVESAAFAGYALPGLVVALAFVFFAARYVPVVYQTVTLVIVAYIVRFFPEALGSVRSSLGQVDPALEEAARSLGRSRLGAVRTVTLPLVRNGLLAGGALVFLTAMKELPATLLLRPPGSETLAVRVWTGASEGLYAQAAPAALLLIGASALVLWPLRQGTRP